MNKTGVPVSENEYYHGCVVTVNGKDCPVHACRVSAMSFNTVWPGHQRPLDQTESAGFVTYDCDGPVTMNVTVKTPVSDAVVRPLSRGVAVSVTEKTASFTLPGAGQYTFEVNGRHNALHIFINEPENEEEKKAGLAATYSFGPGYHEVGMMTLQSGESVYLAPDAVVSGGIFAKDAENIRVFGRGILDGAIYKRPGEEGNVPEGVFCLSGLMAFERCRNVSVEGVVLRDSPAWNVTAINCVGLHYDGLKVIGQWRYNTDGFDLCNCQNVHVNDCFLRTFDDSIVIKGLYLDERRQLEKMNNLHYLIENCVVWCDWGGALEIGAETVCDEYDDILFRNIDIIRNDNGGIRLQSGDRAHIHNIRYEDIRVEYSKYDRLHVYQVSDDMKYEPEDKPYAEPAITAWMYCGRWSPDNILGHVDDIHFKNVAIRTDFALPAPWLSFKGGDETHECRDVTIENVTVNGVHEVPRIVLNSFARDIRIKN